MVFTLIKGVDLELAYTIGAKKDLLKEFGGTEQLAAVFATDSDVQLAENAAKVGAIMAKAEYARQKAKNALLGEPVTARLIEWETIFQLLDGDTTIGLINAITATIREANGTTVDVKPEKKEEATQ